MKYEVRQYTVCEGWVNTWVTMEDGIAKPQTFDSEEEAQAEIDDFFDDIQAEIDSGERDEDCGYDRDDFIIAKVGDE